MNLNLRIPVPFIDHNWASETRRGLFNKWWKVSEHKSIETELVIDPLCLFEFGLNIRPSVKWHDHAGVTLDLGLTGLWFNFTFYDNRHALAYEVIDEDE